ncbi:MAG: maleylpyruvate isomerase family mycothiol-dependent enzyme [Acidimicrobiia bacterium]
MDYWRMTDTERDAFADLCDSLTPAQWDQPSLCGSWKVRDVVAHLNQGSVLTGGRAILIAAKYGFRINTMLEREAQRDGTHSPEQLRKDMRASVGMRRKPPGTKPADLVMETIVHQQDVRRPLGIPRDYPAEELKVALDCAASTGSSLLPGKKRGAGLHLRATDLDWEHGEGDEVSGSGEALLMALAGRSAALADLVGPGVETLRSRITN